MAKAHMTLLEGRAARLQRKLSPVCWGSLPRLYRNLAYCGAVVPLQARGLKH